MAPYIERAIAERASNQLGHINYAQARELGATPKVVRRLASTGRLIPVGSRTFRLAGLPRSLDGDVMAACLDTGGRASHRTASRLSNLGPRSWRELIEVTVVKGTRHTSSPLATVHTSTNLGRDDLVVVRGIPTTSVARTIFDLAALVPAVTLEDLRDLIDVAIRDGRASDAWLFWRLERLRCRGRNGVSVLEAILADRECNGKTESWLERAFLACVDAAGFPRPKVQQCVRNRNGTIARVDFLYEPKTVVEVAGYRWHSTYTQKQADAERRNRLVVAGYDILEFTYGNVVDTPQDVWMTLAAKLGFAMPVLLG
jgi:hypothetical protein